MVRAPTRRSEQGSSGPAPHGSMALPLANGSMSSGSGGEGQIRQALIEAGLVECMVALPGQLFTNARVDLKGLVYGG